MATNILYIVAMVALTQQLVFIAMKVSDYQQPIFIDKYFFTLTFVLNGLFAFMVLLAIMVMLIVQVKWPVDRKVVEDLTEGQVMAIYYIKEAREFQVGLLARKQYKPADKEKMDTIIDNLSMEFNNFRGKQPLIMDALLETIDSLRLIQKNYENDPELFNFDYKTDLTDRARLRAGRVFTLKQFAPQIDEEGNLLNDSTLKAAAGPSSKPFDSAQSGSNPAGGPGPAAAPASTGFSGSALDS